MTTQDLDRLEALEQAERRALEAAEAIERAEPAYSDVSLLVAMRNALPELLRMARERDAIKARLERWNPELIAARAEAARLREALIEVLAIINRSEAQHAAVRGYGILGADDLLVMAKAREALAGQEKIE